MGEIPKSRIAKLKVSVFLFCFVFKYLSPESVNSKESYKHITSPPAMSESALPSSLHPANLRIPLVFFFILWWDAKWNCYLHLHFVAMNVPGHLRFTGCVVRCFCAWSYSNPVPVLLLAWWSFCYWLVSVPSNVGIRTSAVLQVVTVPAPLRPALVFHVALLYFAVPRVLIVDGLLFYSFWLSVVFTGVSWAPRLHAHSPGYSVWIAWFKKHFFLNLSNVGIFLFSF